MVLNGTVHSPDLTPGDFFLFLKLTQELQKYRKIVTQKSTKDVCRDIF